MTRDIHELAARIEALADIEATLLAASQDARELNDARAPGLEAAHRMVASRLNEERTQREELDDLLDRVAVLEARVVRKTATAADVEALETLRAQLPQDDLTLMERSHRKLEKLGEPDPESIASAERERWAVKLTERAAQWHSDSTRFGVETKGQGPLFRARGEECEAIVGMLRANRDDAPAGQSNIERWWSELSVIQSAALDLGVMATAR